MARVNLRGRKRFGGVVSAMNGVSPGFSPPGIPTPVAPPALSLPENFGYQDLAGYEEARRRQFGQEAERTILGRREALGKSLLEHGQKQFEMATPGLLEDLNSRGFLSSPSEVARANAQVLKEIQLGNQGQLFDLDTAATSANLQAQQDALDAGLDLRRGELEQRFLGAQSAAELAQARDLAKQARKQGITESLIGAGGSILGGAIPFLGMRGGGGGGLFRGGASLAGTGFARNAGNPSSSLFPGGLGPEGPGTTTAETMGAGGGLGSALGRGLGALGTGGLLAGAGIGSALLHRAMEKKLIPALGQSGGQAAGFLLNPVGGTINFGKKLVTDPGKTVSNAVKSITNPVSSIGKSISKKICFDASTPVEMEDGSNMEIGELALGDKTKGGYVESIRVSLIPEGDLYDYRGVKVTGSHAVKEEGKWIRVEESSFKEPTENDGTVYSITTSSHRIYVNGITFADEMETDDYEYLTIDESLSRLNERESLIGVNSHGV